MLTEYIPNIRIQGVDNEQLNFKTGTATDVAHIVIGTIEKINIIISDGLNIKNLKFLVMDNFDKFDVEQLQEFTNKTSHHISQNTQRIISYTAVTINVDKLQYILQPDQKFWPLENIIPDSIEHFYIEVDNKDEKYEVIFELLDTVPLEPIIIFCKTKRKVNLISSLLSENEYKVSMIDGDMDEKGRNKSIQEFQEKRSHVLITTDIISQGILIPQVRLVVNYDLPVEKEQYIHRVGRAVQLGKKEEQTQMLGEDVILEQQFILRAAPRIAEKIRKKIRSTRPGLTGPPFSITFLENDHQHATVEMDGEIFPATLVNLPCIIESQKTYDKKTFYKTADISQMLIIHEAGETPLHIFDRDSGITPPTRKITKRHWKQTKKHIDIQNPDEKDENRSIEVELIEDKPDLKEGVYIQRKDQEELIPISSLSNEELVKLGQAQPIKPPVVTQPIQPTTPATLHQRQQTALPTQYINPSQLLQSNMIQINPLQRFMQPGFQPQMGIGPFMGYQNQIANMGQQIRPLTSAGPSLTSQMVEQQLLSSTSKPLYPIQQIAALGAPQFSQLSRFNPLLPNTPLQTPQISSSSSSNMQPAPKQPIQFNPPYPSLMTGQQQQQQQFNSFAPIQSNQSGIFATPMFDYKLFQNPIQTNLPFVFTGNAQQNITKIPPPNIPSQLTLNQQQNQPNQTQNKPPN
ncbi:MAG: putative ATP-dependent RNA helicase eIF4A [Streblomastix strix]|uniref:Putative ATP-dependent RNA helicase eIF4A n=1 Tax=Streblomastix strix TaxID=222440 RepID=A0A5J4WMP9_9EUKA|nr:MAG: putative ATP-dependent RNA helicase eIF4A [Streblomastix strix]